MKTKVVMSADNKCDLEKMINKYYCSENYYLDDNLGINNHCIAYTGNFKVRIKKGRYQVYKEVE